MPSVILAIMAKDGKPLAMDDFTDFLWKTGYAWIRVEINARKPLKPGNLVRGKKGIFWQSFVYKNLPSCASGVVTWATRIMDADFLKGIGPPTLTTTPFNWRMLFLVV